MACSGSSASTPRARTGPTTSPPSLADRRGGASPGVVAKRPESVVEPREQLFRRHDLGSCGGEFDPERQAIEAGHERADCVGRVDLDSERRCAAPEQRDAILQGEGAELHDTLRCGSEPLAGGDQEVRSAGRHPLRDQRSHGRDRLFGVVEHHEVTVEIGERRDEVGATSDRDGQGPGQRLRDVRLGPAPRQVAEPGTAAIVAPRSPDLEREMGLADPAGAGDRHQPDLPRELEDPRQLGASPDQLGGRRDQIAVGVDEARRALPAGLEEALPWDVRAQPDSDGAPPPLAHLHDAADRGVYLFRDEDPGGTRGAQNPQHPLRVVPETRRGPRAAERLDRGEAERDRSLGILERHDVRLSVARQEGPAARTGQIGESGLGALGGRRSQTCCGQHPPDGSDGDPEVELVALPKDGHEMIGSRRIPFDLRP